MSGRQSVSWSMTVDPRPVAVTSHDGHRQGFLSARNRTKGDHKPMGLPGTPRRRRLEPDFSRRKGGLRRRGAPTTIHVRFSVKSRIHQVSLVMEKVTSDSNVGQSESGRRRDRCRSLGASSETRGHRGPVFPDWGRGSRGGPRGSSLDDDGGWEGGEVGTRGWRR